MTKELFISKQSDYNAQFSGLIYLSDFNTHHPNGNIAQRIASDFRFNENCKKNSEFKDKKENF